MNDDLLLRCCEEQAHLIKTGSWSNGIPKCFEEVADLLKLERDGLDRNTWILTVELYIKNRAVEKVADNGHV